MKRSLEWWDRFFLGMARYISTASKDPSTQVGAVITRPDNRIVGVGFNGFARGVEDLPERYENRDLKYLMVLHAEVNCLLFARQDLTGCSIFTHPFPPCARCAGLIIQSGIKRVVSMPPTPDLEARWREDLRAAGEMFEEADVSLVLYPLKEAK